MVRWISLLICLIMAYGFVGWGIDNFYENRAFSRYAQIALVEPITEYQQTHTTRQKWGFVVNEKDSYKATINFKAQNGLSYSAMMMLPADVLAQFSRGEPVKVQYLPTNPQKFRFVGETKDVFLNVIAGLFLSIVGFLIFNSSDDDEAIRLELSSFSVGIVVVFLFRVWSGGWTSPQEQVVRDCTKLSQSDVEALMDGHQIEGCPMLNNSTASLSQKPKDVASSQKIPTDLHYASTTSDEKMTLPEAKKLVQTHISATKNVMKLPSPPSDIFQRVDYERANGNSLPAFITPDTKDGQKHPAIIWLTGGDTNSLDDFWTVGAEGKDQSAHAFRDAGFVMMFPTLRGGNTNTENKEIFYGEVDDVIDAAKFLASQPYVDANKIYLGGFSTGGTLALLVAESTDVFRAIFAFGPVPRVDSYGRSFEGINFHLYPEQEIKLRSPIYWLHGIKKPTYLIEGDEGNSLNELCAVKKSNFVRCVVIKGETHFSVLGKVTPKIAQQLANGKGGTEYVLTFDN